MTSPTPSLICMNVGASGNDDGGAVTRTPDCAIIRLCPVLVQAIGRAVAAARLMDPGSVVPEVRIDMPVAVGLFQGVPIQGGRLTSQVAPLNWLVPDEAVAYVDDSIESHLGAFAGEVDEDCQEWETMRDEHDHQVSVFNPSSFWLKVDQDTFTVNVWDKHGDDELHVRVHLKHVPGLLDQVEDAVQSAYATWGIPEAMRPKVETDQQPAHRERPRG